jgi:hypothetical protein
LGQKLHPVSRSECIAFVESKTVGCRWYWGVWWSVDLGFCQIKEEPEGRDIRGTIRPGAIGARALVVGTTLADLYNPQACY